MALMKSMLKSLFVSTVVFAAFYGLKELYTAYFSLFDRSDLYQWSFVFLIILPPISTGLVTYFRKEQDPDLVRYDPKITLLFPVLIFLVSYGSSTFSFDAVAGLNKLIIFVIIAILVVFATTLPRHLKDKEMKPETENAFLILGVYATYFLYLIYHMYCELDKGDGYALSMMSTLLVILAVACFTKVLNKYPKLLGQHIYVISSTTLIISVVVFVVHVLIPEIQIY